MKLYDFVYFEQAEPSKDDVSIDGYTFSNINIIDEDHNIIGSYDWWQLKDVCLDICDGKTRIIPKLLYECVAVDTESHIIYSVKNRYEDREIDLEGYVVTVNGENYDGNTVFNWNK